MPIPNPIVKAHKVNTTSPGSSATEVRHTSAANASSGPNHSANRSRGPDQPDAPNEPTVQPNEIVMVTKLTNSGDTPCTTCSSSGRNRVTEVCVIAWSDRIHSASPIGAVNDTALAGKSLLPASRSSR